MSHVLRGGVWHPLVGERICQEADHMASPALMASPTLTLSRSCSCSVVVKKPFTLLYCGTRLTHHTGRRNSGHSFAVHAGQGESLACPWGAARANLCRMSILGGVVCGRPPVRSAGSELSACSGAPTCDSRSQWGRGPDAIRRTSSGPRTSAPRSKSKPGKSQKASSKVGALGAHQRSRAKTPVDRAFGPATDDPCKRHPLERYPPDAPKSIPCRRAQEHRSSGLVVRVVHTHPCLPSHACARMHVCVTHRVAA